MHNWITQLECHSHPRVTCTSTIHASFDKSQEIASDFPGTRLKEESNNGDMNQGLNISVNCVPDMHL